MSNAEKYFLEVVKRMGSPPAWASFEGYAAALSHFANAARSPFPAAQRELVDNVFIYRRRALNGEFIAEEWTIDQVLTVADAQAIHARRFAVFSHELKKRGMERIYKDLMGEDLP